MDKEETKPVKEKRFFKNVRGWRRFLLFVGIYLGVFIVLFAGAAEYTSRPSFCPTCHYMETFYNSWKTSQHNKVDCVECHFEPGVAGTIKGKLNGLVQIANYISLTYKKRKPWAEIPDNTCARTGCHETQQFQDSVYDFNGISFSHKNHLQDLRRGKKLKCISCHSQIVQGTHMEVTGYTCFNCHFKKSDDPEHKYDKLSDCNTCHGFQNKSKEVLSSLRYNHVNVVERNYSCTGCHSSVIQGKGEVGKERCFHCHFEDERLNKYGDIEFMHTTHISKHTLKCADCHTPIEHKIQPLDPNAPPDCASCHTNAHSAQVSLFSGQNGFNVDKSPSTMFLNGMNCQGCHVFHETSKSTDLVTSKSSGSACEKCHGEGYDRLVSEWGRIATERVKIVNSIYKVAEQNVRGSSSPKKAEAERMLSEAQHNIRLVEVGKAVHNAQFADNLLVGAYSLMKEALSVIGSSASLPNFVSSSEIVPNECYRCHSGIQEISVRKYDMMFSHNLHIQKQKIACDRCHSNSNKHGETIITKEGCNNCHHTKAKDSDEACNRCHPFQNQVYSGNAFGKKIPDIMKEGGSRCIDCHVEAGKVVKPDNSVCVKCHSAEYADMATEWKNDVRKLLAEVNGLFDGITRNDLSDEQKAEYDEIRKNVSKISAYPSIFVHNNELITTVLSESKKKLKDMK
jgi:nitrate/TMAO reductase-like tetraheme cytochrome c subunit